MNRRQQNLYSMLGRVQALILNNTSKFDSIPILTTLKDEFLIQFNEIGETDTQYLSSKTGKTIAKHLAEDSMIDAVIPLTSAINTYALINGNIELANKVKVSASSLENLRERDTLNKCKEIVAEAELIAEALSTNFGWTADQTGDVSDKVTAFENALNTQEVSGVTKSALRIKLKENFTEILDLLYSKIDKVMELFISTDPDFYNEYQSARVIKDLGVRHEEAVTVPAE